MIEKLLSLYGDCKNDLFRTRPASANMVNRFIYAHNVAKITNRRQCVAITPGPTNLSITKLDIYVGYTEEIIKICARIADIPYLNIDSSAIRLEIDSM